MNRRFPTARKRVEAPSSPVPSVYAAITDADLTIMAEREIALALGEQQPKFPPTPDLNALNILRSKVAALRPWAAQINDPRAQKLAIAALDKRDAEAGAGIEAHLSANARKTAPPLPSAPYI